MGGHRLRALAALAIVATSIATLADPARSVPASDGQTSADLELELELAERYAPIVAIQRQVEACGPGEPYLPTDALSLIDHPDVELRDERGRVVTTAPTAEDLAAAPHDWHIDFPGAALRPGCDFERWFREHGDTHPTLYARVATDPEHPGRLALQYWSFWIYNDWNNLHEGDWEMVQLVFEAPSVEAALAIEPSTMVVAQHEGAERSAWGDVERDGSRPVVYPAGGSHATFFEQGLWLGKRADAGFGCDDSRGPSDRLDPTLVLLPETIDPDGEHAWVSWRGRWGERQPLFNNGPEGPIAKTQWSNPISWMEDSARDSSLRVPVVGGDVTELFCSASERGSLVMVRFFDNPALVLAALAALVVAVVALARRTVWAPVVLRPVDRRRRSGQILRSAWRLVLTERRAFLPVAALVVAGGAAASLARLVLGSLPQVDDLELLLRGDSVSSALLSLTIGGLVTVPVMVLALGAGVRVAVGLDEPDGARPVWPRPQLPVVVIISLLAVVTGPLWWPLGVVLLARWGAAPAVAVGGTNVVESLRTSAVLTKGRRVKTAALLVPAVAIVGIGGPLIGALILIVTATSFTLVNLLAALISAVLVPWLAVVVVLLHADLAHRSERPGDFAVSESARGSQ